MSGLVSLLLVLRVSRAHIVTLARISVVPKQTNGHTDNIEAKKHSDQMVTTPSYPDTDTTGTEAREPSGYRRQKHYWFTLHVRYRHTHTHTHTHTRARTHTHTHANTHSRTHNHTHTTIKCQA